MDDGPKNPQSTVVLVRCASCGVELVDRKDKKRFERRHPTKCREFRRRQDLSARISVVKDESVVSDEEGMAGKMLSALEDMTDRMSDWEKGFLTSLSDWVFTQGRELTPNQRLKLEELYQRYF